MRKILGALLFGAFLATSTGGCTSYVGVAQVGDKVVVAKNNSFLFGVFRRVFVCKATDGGLQNCQKNEAP